MSKLPPTAAMIRRQCEAALGYQQAHLDSLVGQTNPLLVADRLKAQGAVDALTYVIEACRGDFVRLISFSGDVRVVPRLGL